MRPTLAFLLTLCLGLFIACSGSQSGDSTSDSSAGSDDGAQAAGDSPTTETTVPIQCTSEGSLDIEIGPTEGPKIVTFAKGSNDLPTLQCGFDVFSWNSFLAVNHAPDGSFGNHDGDNPTIWESWPESSDIFLTDGAEPPEWPDGQPFPDREVPASCSGIDGAAGMKVLSQMAKRPDVLEASNQPFDSGPLIDVNGWYSRFEITVNQDMYDYIRDHQLYSRSGQLAFADGGSTVSFPCGCEGAPSGSDAADPKCVQDGQEGAIMVKASWKVLATSDDPSTFHTAEALVVTPSQNGEPETCEKQQMGLVGLHIGHKTQPEPQWVWSTFEHVRNAPDADDDPSAGEAFNYFQPQCDDCNAVNTAPPQPWDPHVQPVVNNAGKSQVKRAIPIDEPTTQMNDAVQAALEGTVWLNYELVSTQWPTNGSGSNPGTPGADNGWCNALNAVDNSGVPAPIFLANTTLETYIQGQVPQASSSCINCHLNATMTEGVNNFSDFTYLLERAQGDT